MTNLQTRSAVLLLSTICFLTSAYGQNAASLRAVPTIVEPIDESKRTVLPGNIRGEVRPEFDRGPVDDSFPLNGMQLQLKRSAEREHAAAALADELQRRGSARVSSMAHRRAVRRAVRRPP